MSAQVTRRQIAFAPPDNCRIGPVRVFGPDGTLLRTIPVKTLLTRPAVKPHGTVVPPREEHPDRGPKSRRWSRA